jgi:hypothetical protein
MWDAEDVFELLHSHEQNLALEHLVDIRKQSALQEVEEPET